MKRLLVWCMLLGCARHLSAQSQNNEILDVGADPVISAEYPGGMTEMKKFLDKNTCYSEEAQKAGIQGRVYVAFVVDTLGKIGKVAIKRSLHVSLDEIAMEAVKNMPDWKPATNNGRRVKQRYVLPIVFKINEFDNEKDYSPLPCKNK